MDAEKGIVVVSRNVVPVSLGDLYITIADSIIIPGKVVFLHPTHNITFIQYDPTLLGTTPVRSATISKIPIVQGHKITLAALNHNQRPICINTTGKKIQSTNFNSNFLNK